MATTDWAQIERVLPHARRTLLYGPPGTGKTTTAMAGRPEDEVLVVSLHDESTVAELVGHFVPVGDRFIWLDGPALTAWRFGKRLVVDEIDLANGAVLSILRGILNDKRVARLTIPNQALAGLSDEEIAKLILAGHGQETIKPADGFEVVATMNGEPEDLDEPLRDRFDATFHVTEPHPNALARLPKPLRPVAKRTAVEPNEDRRITLRSWLSFVELAEHVGPDDAGAATFGNRYADVVAGVRLADLFDTGAKGAKPATNGGAPSPAEQAKTALAGLTGQAAAHAKELDRYSRAELRALAVHKGLAQSGHKATLVKRLAEAGQGASAMRVFKRRARSL